MRQQLLKLQASFVRRLREFYTGAHHTVGRQHSWAIGVADYHEAPTPRPRLLRKVSGVIKKIFDCIDLEHANPIESRSENVLIAGHIVRLPAHSTYRGFT